MGTDPEEKKQNKQNGGGGVTSGEVGYEISCIAHSLLYSVRIRLCFTFSKFGSFGELRTCQSNWV